MGLNVEPQFLIIIIITFLFLYSYEFIVKEMWLKGHSENPTEFFNKKHYLDLFLF